MTYQKPKKIKKLSGITSTDSTSLEKTLEMRNFNDAADDRDGDAGRSSKYKNLKTSIMLISSHPLSALFHSGLPFPAHFLLHFAFSL